MHRKVNQATTPVGVQSFWTAVQGDEEMSVQALSLRLFHWLLPLLTARGHIPEQKCRAQVSTDKPTQPKASCLEKSDRLSSLITQIYFAAVELFP